MSANLHLVVNPQTKTRTLSTAEERREDAILGPPLAEDVALVGEAHATAARGHATVESHKSRHTWVVELTDEDSAAVEVDGRQITPIPRWLLPKDAQDGDVLRVTHSRSASRSTLSIEIDREAKRAALEQSAEQVADLPVEGRGDVRL